MFIAYSRNTEGIETLVQTSPLKVSCSDAVGKYIYIYIYPSQVILVLSLALRKD